ncbi:subtilisin-like serine protease [Methanolobus tindarius DSM 2278]|uniref:Subtilisin-like serine protease n=1 Tax=Methanolobus tindarius DSM 2278 TaxID=1090322 RepID=W9DZ81_METTI|nr:putative Ig domain-containing protein [Methanolobus tindarius]ETA69017.1 subtilisin-like serine protease [Methanolobus tindarius DSM 2278]
MTDRKKIAFIFIILLFFTSLASANNDDNIIFLKTGHIDTDLETDANYTEPNTMSVNSASELSGSSYKYYLVQFDGIVQPEWKDAAEATGAVIQDYIPDNTFVLKMNDTILVEVESLEFVRWVGEYLPEYKYDFSLETNENQLSINENQIETIKLNVFLFESADSDEIAREINDINGDIISSSGRILIIVVPENHLDSLASINGISWIEEYSEVVLFNDVAAGIMNVDTVHNDIGLNGSGQIVAVCDTGLDTGVDDSTMHPDFAGRIISIIDYFGDGAADNASAWYNGGHGTHVAGSVLGNGSMSGGQYKGMAPDAELVFEAVQNGTSGGMNITYSNLDDIFQDAYDLGARIHTNSWGYETSLGDYITPSRIVDEFMWEHPDMLILFSVGNSGTDSDKNGVIDINSTSPPATSKNCIAVGASENYRPEMISAYGSSFALPIYEDTKADNIEGIAAFSSRGPTDDGRIKPDVVAPGTYIASTRSSYISWYDWGLIDDNYAYMGGTSMATPLVAGSAALVREYYTEMEHISSPSAALLKATLINGAIDMTPGQYGEGSTQEIYGRPDNSQGWGRVDVANSVINDYPEVIAYSDGESLSMGGLWTHTYDYIESGEPLRATLVWTDYPASASAGKSLVNDLDLTITDSSNSYYGNDGPDHVNNVEDIQLDSTSEGEYTFAVDAYYVLYGPQPFALVASFTCDNNEFPAPGILADSKNTAVSTDVVHPQGVDPDSIVMKINDIPVTFASTPVTDGYNIEYQTVSSYATGEYNVSVSATTETGQDFSYSWNFSVDAESSNNAPVLSSITGSTTVSETYPLTLELSATDADNDTLTFGTNASFGVLNGNTFTWTPGFDDAGSYVVEFNVTDNIEVDSEIVTINVINLDRAPVLTSIGDKTVNENSPLVFSIHAIDDDNDTVTYYANGLPEGAVFDTGSGDFSWTPQYDESGSYSIEFIASSNGINDSETITITVYDVDQNPVLAETGDQEIDENELLTFTISATDPDGPSTITYSANDMPAGATLDSDSGEFAWTPLYSQSGAYDVEFIATSNGLTDSETITITVNNVDRAPVFDTIIDKTVNENNTLTFTISATDPDGDDVTYSSPDKPSGSILDSDSGEFIWTPDYNDEGSYNLEFIASSNGLTDSKIITITVLNVDRPVELNPVDDVTVNETELVAFQISGNDPDGDKVTYSASVLPVNSSLDVESGEFSWITGYTDSGTYEIEFTATANGTTDSETMIITVNNVDRPPVLDSIIDRTVDENNDLVFTVSATDPDGGSVSYSSPDKPSGSTLDTGSGEFSWTPDYDDEGSYSVEFIATSNGLTDSQTMTITVNNVDRAPVLNPIGSKTIDENETLAFTISAADPDGESVTYSVNDLPTGATFNTASGQFVWTPGYGTSGNYAVEFIASSNGLEDSETITIYVGNVDRPPVLNPIGSKTIDENETLAFTISAIDPDEDDVIYSASILPQGSTFDTSSGEFIWTPSYDDSKEYTVEFTASANGLEDTETITITVNNVDRAPVLSAIGDVSVNENEPISFTISASDPDGNSITYMAEDVPGDASFNAASRQFTWTPDYDAAGSYDVTFIAMSNSLNDSETITITVLNVDRSVELDTIEDVTVNESEVVEFVVAGNDPDGDDVSYSASTLPVNSSLDEDSGEFYWMTGYNDSGTYEIEFTATTTGSTDLQSMIITVNNVDRPPELATIGNKTVNENETLTFTVSATDADGDSIVYSASGLPDDAVFDTVTGMFEWTTGYTDAGNYSINFTAVSNGLKDSETINIEVLDVNAPPQFQSAAAQTVQVSTALQFTLNATDIDNDTLVYSNESLPDGAEFNATSLLFNWTPSVNQTGNYYANFTVTDSHYYDYLNVSITVTNATTSVVTTSSAAGGGGGGGGGGGTSGEEYENIAVKDVSSVFVGTGDVIFEFYRDGNDIRYVSYESLKNSGTISATIEVLVDKSAFVSSLPSGEIYRNINIWVGKVGYATEDNIANPVIGFRVDREWIDENDIDPDSIVLNRYDGGWSKLSTWQTDSDDNYLYFEASTSGFSSFVITGETMMLESTLDEIETQSSVSDVSEPESGISTEIEPETSLNALSGFMSCLILVFVCFLRRKQ